jgi:hypothetical protein
MFYRVRLPTYDDVNELLPDGVSPGDLDALYAKLRNVGIEVAACRVRKLVPSSG